MATKELADKLVSWIRDSVSAAGCKGVVFGMSGGVDSSALAVLCHRAFPGTALGVLMPCHSHPEDMEHARLVANKFSIPTKTVVLDSIFDALITLLPTDSINPAAEQLARANLKPRLRMLTLYHIANSRKYMVAGSSNKSELAIGYYTKHGDSGVDILPLGNLVKGEVRELARSLGIPQAVIDKPPSAGLWAGQTDEGDMGMSYEELDRYLTAGIASSALREKIEAMMAANRHKQQPPPIAEL